VTVLNIAWIAILTLGCAYYFISAMLVYRATRISRTIDEYEFEEPGEWPKVSVIIAACNEADGIEGAVRSKLGSDYPDFEMILIDDRSTDRTGKIIDRLAKEDKRIRAIHITELPEGWMGKQHALMKGVSEASGEYYLFTDADVRLSKDIIRKTVAFCEDRGIDQLGAGPSPWGKTFFLNLAILAFFRMYIIGARTWAVDYPKAKAFTGVGAYNLVRRSAYERTGGFEWIRMDIADDAALALMIRESGGKTFAINGLGAVEVEWYESVKDMASAMERGSFTTVGNGSFLLNVVFGIGLFIIEMAPFLSMLMTDVPWLQQLGAASAIVGVLGAMLITQWLGGPMLPAFFYPVGIFIFGWMLLRGGYLGWKRGGIFWRGRFYSKEELVEGRRVSLP